LVAACIFYYLDRDCLFIKYLVAIFLQLLTIFFSGKNNQICVTIVLVCWRVGGGGKRQCAARRVGKKRDTLKRWQRVGAGGQH